MSGFWQRKPPAPSWWSQWNPFYFPVEHVEDRSDPPPDYGYFCQSLSTRLMRKEPELRFPSRRCRSQLQTPDQPGRLHNHFNASSDLCTVGPQLSNQHGMLFAASSMLATHKLIPIFGECKVNINNDILFPANMYWKHDKWYEYSDAQDISWQDKDDVMPWRGGTSGGLAFEDKPEEWKKMHRQRLVSLTNATTLDDSTISVFADSKTGTYAPASFQPSKFAAQHTDVGFTGFIACLPNCSFYETIFSLKSIKSLAQTFRSKYLVDVDGHSFSGRWRAFLQSRSLGIKARIFREWHDSRLFAWKHFVPMDNRFDELYNLLTYFIGLSPTENAGPMVRRHDHEAQLIASQGREWADRVLRREDMEIYLSRLLLEYGRVIDDERDYIGFTGDGGAVMREFDRLVPSV
ncbi:hypothetical protein LTR49_024561 [Elasticomyces elasticus]|nr:hypothetical protein LTR49_024561 [Elasticomyces elasticus]